MKLATSIPDDQVKTPDQLFMNEVAKDIEARAIVEDFSFIDNFTLSDDPVEEDTENSEEYDKDDITDEIV